MSDFEGVGERAAAAASTLALLEWRRQVHRLYAEVRAAAATSVGPAAAHALWRDGRNALFATHPSTPILPEERDAFAGLPVPDYDPAWRFTVEVEPAEPARLDVPTGSDGIVPFERAGVVRLGDLGTLDVWWLGSYGGGVFVPLKDASAGTPGGTYGGGRYLLDTVKGADLGGEGGSLILDLNFAYNPSCAYDPEWACPLAPAGNTLHVDVPVGERSWH